MEDLFINVPKIQNQQSRSARFEPPELRPESTPDGKNNQSA